MAITYQQEFSHSVDEADVVEALECGELDLRTFLVKFFKEDRTAEEIEALHDEVNAAVAEMGPEARTAFDRFSQTALKAIIAAEMAAMKAAAEEA